MAMLGSKIQTFHNSIGGSHQMISSDVIDLMGQQIDLIYTYANLAISVIFKLW